MNGDALIATPNMAKQVVVSVQNPLLSCIVKDKADQLLTSALSLFKKSWAKEGQRHWYAGEFKVAKH